MTDTATDEVRIESAIEPVMAEWDALADRVGAPPFARAAWFAAWRRAFGSGDLELITLRRKGNLAGVLPTERRRGVVRGTVNYHSPAFAAVAEDPAAERAMCELALNRASRRLSLAQVPADDGLPAEADAAATAAGCRVLRRVQQRTPVVPVEGEWDSYLGGLSRGFRKELRRFNRRLDEQGQVDFEVTTGEEGLGERLEEVFAVEGTGWKLEQGTAIISRPETRRFYEEVAAWAAASGFLRLFILRLAGRAIAVDFALESGGVRYLLKGGFDPDYAKAAPGLLLLERGLAHGFAAGLERIELGGGDDSYKLRWTSTVRAREVVQAFPSTPLGLADWATLAYGRPIAQRFYRGRRRRNGSGG
jgi:CelD/BcsL family acetyltransferase involved in cellulose biosynthesis